MAQVSLQGELKYEVEYDSPTAQVYDFWTRRRAEIPKLCPDMIHNIELVEGSWENEGGILMWKYNIDGKVQTCEVINEKVDKEKNILYYKVIGGDLLEPYYKSFKFIGEITPKDDGGCLASWTLDYEKLNENIPDPISMRDAAIQLNKLVNAYLAHA